MSDILAARFASNTLLMVSADKADWLTKAMPVISARMVDLQAKLEANQGDVLAYDDFWPAPDSWLNAYRPYKVVDGTLLVPVKGMLLNDFGYQLGDWATGYNYIVKAFQRGMEDSMVERIAMIMDTPGGEVAGCFDAADLVFAMRGTKPIRAFVNEAAYSAGYAWASVADKITMTRTAGVGSIGVVTSHMDVSGAMDKAGVKVTFIHAGDHKVDGNPYEPLPADVKARIQKRIDSMYSIFVSTTARNLGIEESVVRGTQALTYGAEEAVALGLAHEVQPFNEALAAFSGELDKPAGDDVMSTKPNDQGQATFSQADLDNARAEGFASGLKDGAKAEQARVKGIMGCDAAKLRPTMSFHLALNTQQSVEEATGILAVSPEEKPAAKAEDTKAPGADFAAAMEQGNPNLGAGDGSGDQLNATQQLEKEFLAATGYGSK